MDFVPAALRRRRGTASCETPCFRGENGTNAEGRVAPQAERPHQTQYLSEPSQDALVRWRRLSHSILSRTDLRWPARFVRVATYAFPLRMHLTGNLTRSDILLGGGGPLGAVHPRSTQLVPDRLSLSLRSAREL